MSEFMHTPGPWFADDHRVKCEHGSVASFWSPREISDERLDGESWLDMRNRTQPERTKLDREVAANAKLGAAAPDLLAALQEIAAMTGYVDCDICTDVRITADAAIAKATGHE